MAAPVLQFKRGLLVNLPGLRAGEPGFTTDTYDLYVGLTSEVSGNKFFGSHRYWRKEDGTTSLRFALVDKDGINNIQLKSPDTLAGIVTYTLPGTQGASSSVLTNDGSGNLTWASGSANPVFTGIATFSDTTDNTLGNADTGAVQIDGGVGINKNLTVGAGLSVAGQSYFIGTATFYGGQINLGDSDTDDIVVAGEFKSNLIPSDDATYNLGTGSKRWNNASFSGIVTAATGGVFDGVQIGINGANVIDTVSGNLTINSAGGQTIIDDLVTIQNNLTVNGNVTVGGTTVTLRGEDVYIENKDIILGFTTSVTPNDDTANHAGVAIASTVGSPLVSFSASGINTLPDTYKQLMWFKSGTLGFSTDAFAFNYGVAIGTTSMADGVRFAVGSGITMTDTEISATTFRGALVGNASSADQVKTVTASNNNASYHITFVDANNGSATNESVYTDDAIVYNPGTNTLQTQHALFTGNVDIQGTLTATVSGTISTATRANTVDTTSTSTNTNYHLVFTDSASSSTGATMRVDGGIYYNPSSNNLFASQFIGDIQAGTVKSSTGNTVITLSGTNATFANNLKVVGVSSANNFISTSTTLQAPTAGDYSGERLRLYDFNDPAKTNYAIGAEGSHVWFGVDANNDSQGFKWYGHTTEVAKLGGTGNLTIAGDLRINGNDIKASDGTTALTLSASSGNVKTGGDLIAGSGYLAASDGTRALYMYGTSGDVSFQGKAIVNSIRSATDSNNAISLAGRDVTLENNATIVGVATVGVALSVPTIRTATLQHQNGTQAATIDSSGNITASQNLTVSGNLYVNGSTTQVNTSSITVEDRTIELGQVDGSTPSSATTWDLGVLFNYNSSGAKKSAVIWEHADGRFKFGSQVSDGGGTDNDSPQITVSNYAAIEIGGLWVNDCAGQSQVINCTGGIRTLENITIDAGQF